MSHAKAARPRSSRAWSLAFAALAVSAGCTGHVEKATHALWIFGADAPRFDPDGPPDVRRWSVERELSRGLLEEDASGRAVPAAAESVSVSPDSLVYTFHLRRGLRFADGTPCASDAFRSALVAGLGRPDHATRAWVLAAVRGVDQVRVGKPLPALGIDAPDPATLVLRLRARDPLLLTKLAMPGSSDAWKIRSRGAVWGDAVGLGPYRVLRADSTRQIVLVRAAKTAFREPGGADTVSIRFVPSAVRVRNLLRSGRPDLAWPLPVGLLAESLPQAYRVGVLEPHPARRLMLVQRADLPPTSRLSARHALAHGINRTDVVRSLAQAADANQPWVAGARAFEFPSLDPREVQEWRQRGGLGRSFHVYVAYDANGPCGDVARILQGEWANQSIYAELRPLAGDKWRDELSRGLSHLVLVDEGDLIDGVAGLVSASVMPARGPAVGPVRTGWRTREFDSIIALGERAPQYDPDALQNRLSEELVALPLTGLRFVWVERDGGPSVASHPRFGPRPPKGMGNAIRR
jgi:ABC-type transport system substrate-binding protein